MSTPKPAQVADYDSDESRIVSGTEVSAKTSSRHGTQEQSSSRAPKQGERVSRSTAPTKAASDSGYSSAKAAPAPAVSTTSAKVAPVQSQKNATSSLVRPKPTIRQDSARSTTRAATISNTTAKRKDCTDSNCRDPNCESIRNTERRYTIADPKRSSMPPPPPAQSHYQYQPQYDWAATPLPSTVAPVRRGSMSRPRPQSIHAGIPMTYQAAHPSAAPGYNYGYGYGPQQPVYGATPPTQPAAYSLPSPVKATVPSSPLTSTYPNFPVQPGKISARQGNPNVPGLNTSIAMPAPGPAYTMSAGGMSARGNRRSVQYPEQRRSRDDEYTSSESESSDDERYGDRGHKAIDYEQYRSKSRRRRSVVIEDPRRPANRKSYTTSSVPTRQSSRRESTSRPNISHRTISDPAYMSSSENYDSGTTSKAVLDRNERDRRDASKRHSRRLSVSTAGDSYDTPPTSISDNTNRVEAVIEDAYGRRRVYLTREQYDDLLRRRYERDDRESARDRLEKQRMREDRIERYQQEQRAGFERQDLTARNIKQSTKSQVSGRSHKSAASDSKVSTRGGLTLESGGTRLYLEEGIQAISLKVDDDGGMRVVIPSGSGREQSYHGSKSSGSRVARSRTARPRPVQEEQQYEQAL